jgi:hypothetical protein
MFAFLRRSGDSALLAEAEAAFQDRFPGRATP